MKLFAICSCVGIAAAAVGATSLHVSSHREMKNGDFNTVFVSLNMGSTTPDTDSSYMAGKLLEHKLTAAMVSGADAIAVGVQELDKPVMDADGIFNTIIAALAHVVQGNAATPQQVTAFRSKYDIVAKGNAGVLNTISDKSQRFTLLVRKDSGATIVANSVFSETFGFAGTKGFIGAFVQLADSGDRLVLASTHMPMNGDEKAPQWRVGLDERAGSMAKMMAFLRKHSAWVEGRTTFLLAGDTNMRVDTDGEQLKRVLEAAASSAKAEDAKYADFAGFVEPRYPSSFTCRFQSRDKVVEANRAAYDKCREGGGSYAAVDAQGAVTPVSVFWKDLKVVMDRAAAPNKKAAPVCATSDLLDISEKGKVYSDAVKRELQRACDCASLDHFRPFSFCDRVITRPASPLFKVDYLLYESVPLQTNTDHNAVVAVVDVTAKYTRDRSSGIVSSPDRKRRNAMTQSELEPLIRGQQKQQ